MKYFLILFTSFVFNTTSFTQIFVDTLDLNKATDIIYIEVTFPYKLQLKRFSCSVDYGQERRTFRQTSFLRNEHKNKIYFKSEVEGLNFLYKQGWILVTALNAEDDPKEYIFKRKD